MVFYGETIKTDSSIQSNKVLVKYQGKYGGCGITAII